MKKAILIIILLLIVSCGTQASVPMKMNIQGKLTDAQGNAVNGTKKLGFWFYAANGEMKTYLFKDNVAVSNGVFSINKEISEIAGISKFNEPYSLVVGVADPGGNYTILPAQELTTVPYAFNAERLGGKTLAEITGGGGIGDYVKKSGDKMSGPLIVQPDAGAAAAQGKISDKTSGILGYKYASAEENQQMSLVEVGVFGSTATVGGYSGYFDGGRGVYINGSLEVTKGITINGKPITAPQGEQYLTTSSVPEIKKGPLYVNWANNPSNIGITVSGKDKAVYGIVTSAGKAVFGENTGKGEGVSGVSSLGIGVYGKGLAAGGSFESGEVGVYGKGWQGVYGVSPNGFGVYGITKGQGEITGGVFGAYWEQDKLPVGFGDTKFGVTGFSEKGAGVIGISADKDQAAMLAKNTGGGPALELGQGKLKIAASTGTGAANNPVQSTVGSFNFNFKDSKSYTVYNTAVTGKSLIFLTIKETGQFSNLVTGLTEVKTGYFQVTIATGKISQTPQEAQKTGKIFYMIVN